MTRTGVAVSDSTPSLNPPAHPCHGLQVQLVGPVVITFKYLFLSGTRTSVVLPAVPGMDFFLKSPPAPPDQWPRVILDHIGLPCTVCPPVHLIMVYLTQMNLNRPAVFPGLTRLALLADNETMPCALNIDDRDWSMLHCWHPSEIFVMVDVALSAVWLEDPATSRYVPANYYYVSRDAIGTCNIVAPPECIVRYGIGKDHDLNGSMPSAAQSEVNVLQKQ